MVPWGVGVRLKEKEQRRREGKENTPAGGHCFFEKHCLSTNRVCD